MFGQQGNSGAATPAVPHAKKLGELPYMSTSSTECLRASGYQDAVLSANWINGCIQPWSDVVVAACYNAGPFFSIPSSVPAMKFHRGRPGNQKRCLSTCMASAYVEQVTSANVWLLPDACTRSSTDVLWSRQGHGHPFVLVRSHVSPNCHRHTLRHCSSVLGKS